MSVHKIAVVECDTCGKLTLPDQMSLMDAVHIEGGPPAHAADARTFAHRKGWTHTARGKDLCPECRPSPRPAAKPHARNPSAGWGKK